MTTEAEKVAEAERIAPTIRLRRSAVWATRETRWNDGLRRTYRESFVEHGGRYFRIERQNTRDWWDVLEIKADGTFVDYLTVAARNLPAARLAIALCVAGVDKDEVSRRAISAPGAPTGRTLARKRDKERDRERARIREQHRPRFTASCPDPDECTRVGHYDGLVEGDTCECCGETITNKES